MRLSGGGKVRKREKSQHHVLLINLWKSNAGTVFSGLWQRKEQKALSMGCIIEQT